MSRVAERIPGWLERLLIPTLESRVRTIVKEEVDTSRRSWMRASKQLVQR